jgi:hypothetical protein
MPGEKQKTYRRFLGMIFSGGFRKMLLPGTQGLAARKDTKKRKNTKNS